MFSHVMLGADDIAVARKFYDATLGTIGVKPGIDDGKGRVVYMHDGGILLLTPPINGEAASCGNGMTIGFKMATPEQAKAWHDAGVANGGTSIEDAPGERPGSGMYLAYLRDPSGNKLCALHRLPK